MHPEINEEVARKVLETVDVGLCAGVGNPVPGQMCVEAAVNYALGRPHGDDPGCVSQALRSLKITLNDAAWSSDNARAAGLRRLALTQLGSLGVLDDIEFTIRVSLLVYKDPGYIAWATKWLTGEEHSQAAAGAAGAAWAARGGCGGCRLR